MFGFGPDCNIYPEYIPSADIVNFATGATFLTNIDSDKCLGGQTSYLQEIGMLKR